MSQVKTIVTSVSGVGFQPQPINVAKVAWKQLNWKTIEKAVFKLHSSHISSQSKWQREVGEETSKTPK